MLCGGPLKFALCAVSSQNQPELLLRPTMQMRPRVSHDVNEATGGVYQGMGGGYAPHEPRQFVFLTSTMGGNKN